MRPEGLHQQGFTDSEQGQRLENKTPAIESLPELLLRPRELSTS